MAVADFSSVPAGLPQPSDDGACKHLSGLSVPTLQLVSTNGSPVDLSELQGLVVLFCYPMTGKPGTPLPPGWDDIPGARGCTPQACSYRDHHSQVTRYGATVFGLSTQTPAYQSEAAQRLRLPYALLSDDQLELATALQLPTFTVDSVGELIKRLTLILKDGVIQHCIYPVFPSSADVAEVQQWLQIHSPAPQSA